MAVNRDDRTDLPDRGRRSARRWTKWFWWVVLILVLAGGIYLATLRHHWRAEFHQRIEAVRAAGFPVTSKELDAWYPWPQSGANAANWITGAATLLQELNHDPWKSLGSLLGRPGERPRAAEPLSAEIKKSLEQYIRDNAQALESLHEAAAIAECRYPVDFSIGAATVIPHISDVRDGCRLLCLEAILHAENGDPNGAAQATEALLHVAGSLDQEPVLTSHMVRMAGVGLAAIALERTLNQVRLTEPQLARLQKVFLDIHADEGLARALAGNRCMYLEVFERPQSLDRQSFGHLPPVPILEAYDALGLSAREGTVFLDYMAECLRIAQLPPFKRPAAMKAAETRFRVRRRFLLDQFGYLSFLIPHETQQMAWIEVAKTALALERYGLAHASLPETLSQLVPDYLAVVPEDPFDGAPLRYKRTDQGFVVYSVGEDGKDDGGKVEPQKRQGETYDLVFSVERPLIVTP